MAYEKQGFSLSLLPAHSGTAMFAETSEGLKRHGSNPKADLIHYTPAAKRTKIAFNLEPRRLRQQFPLTYW
jgi:hypothetical protein